MLDWIIGFLKRRKQAYLNVFNPESEFAKIVLHDLGLFCRAQTTCFHEDPRKHALAEGRREVWLRIMDHMKLTQDEFFEKYKISAQGK